MCGLVRGWPDDYEPGQVWLWTSRYQNQNLIRASGLAAVGTSRGRPKFKLSYPIVAEVQMLMPDGYMFGIKDEAEFERVYRRKLQKFGVKAIRHTLEEINHHNGGKGLVLLCYEDVVDKGDFCHRRAFADWWHEKTGEYVMELEHHPAPPAEREPIVEQKGLFG